MADGPVEDQFPQPIAAPEEAQAAPGQASPAPQPAQNEAQNICEARCFRVLVSS